MSDRLFEHPASVLVFTNLFYSEAPWLKPKSMASSNSMVWKEVALQGGSSHEFASLNELRAFLMKIGKQDIVLKQEINL